MFALCTHTVPFIMKIFHTRVWTSVYLFASTRKTEIDSSNFLNIYNNKKIGNKTIYSSKL